MTVDGTDEGPRAYDREYTKVLDHRARIRMGYSTTGATVTRFLVQLERHIGDSWTPVVRFDHNPDSEHGHDVSEDGVHVDVYRSGEKVRVEEIFPPTPPGAAFTLAEEHLSMHHERYLERFDRWHRTDQETR